jgi:hypothetical protein
MGETMPAYDDVLERSRPAAPFSNGTEGEAWMAGWCSRDAAPCVRDEQFGAGPEKSACPLLDVALFENRTPQEWGERTSALGREMYTCRKYEAAK